MPTKSTKGRANSGKAGAGVSETTNIAETYAKRRKSVALKALAESQRAVSETTIVEPVYPKQRKPTKRIRNDEDVSVLGPQTAQKSLFTDDEAADESLKSAKVLSNAAQARKDDDEAYAKRRTSRERMGNDEVRQNVSETTKVSGASAKQRSVAGRMRNDESSSPQMRGKTKRAPLAPDLDVSDDLFICDVLDAIPKDDMATMEHPIFTLSTQPDMREIHYEHNGTKVDIWPSRLGMATIHDKDILIYCISQLVAKMNNNEPLGRTLRLKAYDLLTWSKRQTSGDGYARLVAALDRLSGTRIKTNIVADDQEFANGFGLITEYQIVKNSRTGQMLDVKVTLSDWIFKMVQGKSVLTLHKDYFRLRKPIERRIYELARKHCGSQARWPISMDLLQKKTGSQSNIRLFRQSMRELERTNHLPDYIVELDKDNVIFHHRDSLAAPTKAVARFPFVDEEGIHDAKLVAPGYDVHALYQEWGEWWVTMGSPALHNANAAFVGFCRKKHEQAPLRKT